MDAARLVNGWAAFLRRIEWEWFLTLTFDPKKRFPASAELASREAFTLCGLIGFVYRRPIGWAFAVERSPGGLWHAHALIVGIGAPRWLPILETWRERNGGIVAKEVTDVQPAVLYVSKDLADVGEVVWSDTLPRFVEKPRRPLEL